MLVGGLYISNVRSFDNQYLSFQQSKGNPYRWVTLLGENGGGKSTLLQTLGLLLAGPEGAQALVPRPIGWLRNEPKIGFIGMDFYRGSNDSGTASKKFLRSALKLTGRHTVSVDNQIYTEPTILPYTDSGMPSLSFLRETVFASRQQGWFSAGYGAFRRLTRSHQLIVPVLEPQARYTNFLTQFYEDEPLATFERWMVYLDYVIAKTKRGPLRKQAQLHRELGIEAVNRILPGGARFESVTGEGRILFNLNGRKVPTLSMSDGYRSILALAGDLVWRLIQSFPESKNPLHEEGVVLIDELDIHLHPRWQRNIAGWLREQFPNIQFIVATHSPFVAAGAGEDALTLKLTLKEGVTQVKEVKTPVALSVDKILQSEAFGQLSPYSPPTQESIDRYDNLAAKRKRTRAEESEFSELRVFMQQARPVGGPPEPGSLDAKLEAYIGKTLRRASRR